MKTFPKKFSTYSMLLIDFQFMKDKDLPNLIDLEVIMFRLYGTHGHKSKRWLLCM